jgi:hypothetical protein
MRASVSQAPTLVVREVRLLERNVHLRLPFRYGAITLREAPQAFAHVRVEIGGRSAWGTAAEMLAPKWFDKNPALSDAENIDQLRDSLLRAATYFLDAGESTAFRLSLQVREALACDGVGDGNGLVRGYGPALLERAVLDAALRISGIDFAEAIRCNLPGITFECLAPDLAGFDGDAFLSSLAPASRVAARHTVGMSDPLHAADQAADAPDDGLPVTLDQIVECYGNRWFKVKIGGDVDEALERLSAVSATLDSIIDGHYGVTLDGNEQYADVDALTELAARASRQQSLKRFLRGVACFEQPLGRDMTPEVDVHAIASTWPLIIDEADSSPEAFLLARARGYSGVSTKQCKGFYKSLTNTARCVAWNAEAGQDRYFMSAEDLTCQGGISVQQDLAIAAVIGITHVERNGHHFGGPMPDASTAEQRAFLRAHPDLYEEWGDGARLRIKDGTIELGSLSGPGFAHSADPDFDTMTNLVGAGNARE